MRSYFLIFMFVFLFSILVIAYYDKWNLELLDFGISVICASILTIGKIYADNYKRWRIYFLFNIIKYHLQGSILNQQ